MSLMQRNYVMLNAKRTPKLLRDYNPDVKRDERGRILPGQKALRGPHARTKTRNRLSTQFIIALYEDFEENGAAAIAACRKTEPSAYVRTIASLLPKDVAIDQTKQL